MFNLRRLRLPVGLFCCLMASIFFSLFCTAWVWTFRLQINWRLTGVVNTYEFTNALDGFQFDGYTRSASPAWTGEDKSYVKFYSGDQTGGSLLIPRTFLISLGTTGVPQTGAGRGVRFEVGHVLSVLTFGFIGWRMTATERRNWLARRRGFTVSPPRSQP